MMYDCFTFFNELELLDIRLHELGNVVDKFVLVESTVTFTNKKKDLIYLKNKDRYKDFDHKIIHVIVDDSPNVLGNPWIIEMYQFNAIQKALKECKKGDTILLSNVDEIPNKSTLKQWIPESNSIIGFSQDLYYYYLNCQAVDKKWVGTRMINFDYLDEKTNPYIVRHEPISHVIEKGGWHFSYMGGSEKIREKIFSFAHQEFNNPKYNTPEKIELAILTQTDLFNRGMKFESVNIEKLPEYVKKNSGKFTNLLLPKKNSSTLIKPIYLKVKDKLRKIFSSLRSIHPN